MGSGQKKRERGLKTPKVQSSDREEPAEGGFQTTIKISHKPCITSLEERERPPAPTFTEFCVVLGTV